MGFDLDTSTGVAQLLAAVRASELPPAEKNELRDLVLSYANSHEPSIKNALEQKVATYKLIPVAPLQSSTPAPAQRSYPFGTTRPAPTVKQPTAPATQSTPMPVAETPAPTPAPVAPIPVVPQPVPTEPVAATPPSQPVPAPAEPIPSAAPAPVTPTLVPEPVAPVAAAPAAPLDTGAYLTRIKEIKADVNARSDNPANLIDATNGTGREYMAALLDAMKKLNSGTSPKAAMDRLESAYEAVLQSLEAHENPVTAPAPVAEPVSAAPAPTPMPAVDATPMAEPVMPEPAPATPKTDGNPVPINLPTAPQSPASVEPVPATSVSFTPPPTLAETAHSTPPAVHTEPTPVRGPKSVEAATENPRLPDPPRVQPQSALDNLPKAKPVSSLADSARAPHKPTELPDAASLETSSVAGDPLYTKEVDIGLNQLLVEWPLFKKSGLFGTGPKGKEHPLFLKIKDLQIPLLLAGRFEGATQEIKQSITDYMNGWRYEQGIIYEQGETFEHYLRRVIRHILDLQKQ